MLLTRTVIFIGWLITVVCAFIFGKFGLGGVAIVTALAGWSTFSCFALAADSRRKDREFELSMHDEPIPERPSADKTSINLIVAKVYHQLLCVSTAGEWVQNNLTVLLNDEEYKPEWVAPTIRSVHVYRRNAPQEVLLDLDITYSGDISMALAFKLKMPPVTVNFRLTDLLLSGTLRVGTKVSPDFPHVMRVSCGFVGRPKLNLSIKTVGSLELFEIPLLRTWLMKFLTENVIDWYVLPHQWTYYYAEWYPEADEEELADDIGFARVDAVDELSSFIYDGGGEGEGGGGGKGKGKGKGKGRGKINVEDEDDLDFAIDSALKNDNKSNLGGDFVRALKENRDKVFDVFKRIGKDRDRRSRARAHTRTRAHTRGHPHALSHPHRRNPNPNSNNRVTSSVYGMDDYVYFSEGEGEGEGESDSDSEYTYCGTSDAYSDYGSWEGSEYSAEEEEEEEEIFDDNLADITMWKRSSYQTSQKRGAGASAGVVGTGIGIVSSSMYTKREGGGGGVGEGEGEGEGRNSISMASRYSLPPIPIPQRLHKGEGEGEGVGEGEGDAEGQSPKHSTHTSTHTTPIESLPSDPHPTQQQQQQQQTMAKSKSFIRSRSQSITEGLSRLGMGIGKKEKQKEKQKEKEKDSVKHAHNDNGNSISSNSTATTANSKLFPSIGLSIGLKGKMRSNSISMEDHEHLSQLEKAMALNTHSHTHTTTAATKNRRQKGEMGMGGSMGKMKRRKKEKEKEGEGVGGGEKERRRRRRKEGEKSREQRRRRRRRQGEEEEEESDIFLFSNIKRGIDSMRKKTKEREKERERERRRNVRVSSATSNPNYDIVSAIEAMGVGVRIQSTPPAATATVSSSPPAAGRGESGQRQQRSMQERREHGGSKTKRHEPPHRSPKYNHTHSLSSRQAAAHAQPTTTTTPPQTSVLVDNLHSELESALSTSMIGGEGEDEKVEDGNGSYTTPHTTLHDSDGESVECGEHRMSVEKEVREKKVKEKVREKVKVKRTIRATSEGDSAFSFRTHAVSKIEEKEEEKEREREEEEEGKGKGKGGVGGEMEMEVCEGEDDLEDVDGFVFPSRSHSGRNVVDIEDNSTLLEAVSSLHLPKMQHIVDRVKVLDNRSAAFGEVHGLMEVEFSAHEQAAQTILDLLVEKEKQREKRRVLMIDPSRLVKKIRQKTVTDEVKKLRSRMKRLRAEFEQLGVIPK